ERPRGRAITLVADRLVGDHREVVELGFETEIVEKIDLDFHADYRDLSVQNESGRHYPGFQARSPVCLTGPIAGKPAPTVPRRAQWMGRYGSNCLAWPGLIACKRSRWELACRR